MLLGLSEARLGRALQEAGLPDQGILLAEGRRQLQPQQAEKVRGALREVERLARPPARDILLAQGNAYYHLGQYDLALADFNRSLALRPDHPDTLTNRGVAYGGLGKYDLALADYNRSLALRPDDPATLYNLACLFSLWNRRDEAIGYLERAIGGDEKYRGMAKGDKDFDNIRGDPRFRRLVEAMPKTLTP